MNYVECTTRPGLRDSEVGVTVVDSENRLQRLRVEKDFLVEDQGRFYLPIGVVAKHPQDGRVLVELPLEADSGTWRLWVNPSQLLQEKALVSE